MLEIRDEKGRFEKTILKSGDIISFDPKAQLLSMNRKGGRLFFKGDDKFILDGGTTTFSQVVDLLAYTHGFQANPIKVANKEYLAFVFE